MFFDFPITVSIILLIFLNKLFNCFAELEVSDSGLYTCTASSESGETSWSASLSVEESPGSRLHRAPDPAMFPAAPSVPTIVNVTKNSVTVTWQPPTPHLGASPIIGYTLEYYSSDLQTGWVVAAHRISTNTMIVSTQSVQVTTVQVERPYEYTSIGDFFST